MIRRPNIQRFTALLFVLIFLAGSMTHLWHHCCEGLSHGVASTSAVSISGASTSAASVSGASTSCTSTSAASVSGATLMEHASHDACCHPFEVELMTENASDHCAGTCYALTNPSSPVTIHHHHHTCCEHNLSPVIDEAVTKNTVKQLVSTVIYLPILFSILPGSTQPATTDYPPSTLQRTGRQLLASHCVLGR